MPDIQFMNLIIETPELSHHTGLFELYKEISKDPDGIIRNEHEISEEFISTTLKNARRRGLILVAILDRKIVGEIHAITPEIYAFQHMLSDLTIVVHPAYQGQGIGRMLFEKFLMEVKTRMKHILRIELYVREHNEQNVNFYKSLGFINEGGQHNKIFVSPTEFETPIHMAWFNPNYQSP